MLLDATPPLVAGWQNFYLIIGPSAAALMGLQFVVVALVKEAPVPKSEMGVSTFTTPTIVHFAFVLTIAAVLSAPWPSLRAITIALAACSIAGVLYVLLTLRRIARITVYRPVAEDWLSHVALPLIAYGTLAVAAFVLPAHVAGALFVVAAAVMLLLFTGIHNAWDVATYLTLQSHATPEPSTDAGADSVPAQ